MNINSKESIEIENNEKESNTKENKSSQDRSIHWSTRFPPLNNSLKNRSRTTSKLPKQATPGTIWSLWSWKSRTHH